jgi:heme exporter protein A
MSHAIIRSIETLLRFHRSVARAKQLLIDLELEIANFMSQQWRHLLNLIIAYFGEQKESRRPQPMLSATRIVVQRGGRTIVAGVSFYADAGRALVIHGANGSGKTTLIAALAGLLPLTSGAVCWHGTQIRDDSERFHRDLALLGHRDGIRGELTVLENLRFAACPDAGIALRQDVLDAAGLAMHRHTRVEKLSQEQKRCVALVCIVISKKPLWLLDDPADTLDDHASAWFTACVNTHLRAGGTVIAATHRSVEFDADRTRHLYLERWERGESCCA